MELEEIEKKVNYGLSIVNELFKLSDDELKSLLKKMLNSKYHHVLGDNIYIERVIVNEKPNKITLAFYDYLIIEWSGISYSPEHGTPKTIRTFDEFFTLNIKQNGD